jgi:hypothetical protein
MKLSKEQLRKIIKEELGEIVRESYADRRGFERRPVHDEMSDVISKIKKDRRELVTQIDKENPRMGNMEKKELILKIAGPDTVHQDIIDAFKQMRKRYSDEDDKYEIDKQLAQMGVNVYELEEGEELEPMMENEEESSLEKILKILDSAEGGLRFSDIVKQAGMPKKDVVDIYYDYEELFQQIYDGGTKYKLSKRGQEALNPPDDDEQYRKGLQGQAALGLGSSFFEHKGHEGGLKLTKEQLTKIVIEEIEKAKTRLIDRALEVEKKGHKGSEMSAEKEAKFKSWASKQSEEALRKYINDHK